MIEIGHRTWPVIYEPIAGIDYVAMGLAKWWTSDVVAASIRRGQTLVAELAGDVIGMVAFGTQNGTSSSGSSIVLPEHHGKGIGSHLMEAVVERALEAGHTRITVAYPDGNTYAERFHRAHGFVESHREPSGSGLPDTIWMVRELGPSDGAAEGVRRPSWGVHVSGRPDAAAHEAARNLEELKRMREIEEAILDRAPENDVGLSLERIAAVMELAGDLQRSYPGHPSDGHQRQDVDESDDRLDPAGERTVDGPVHLPPPARHP